jgi:hypothetical protein
VQKNNIKLVHLSSKTNDHIDGAISYDKYDNKVVFVPSALLPVGTYEVEIKSLKADKAYKSTQIKEIKYRFYVPEVINGHQLPPEPDPVVNDLTLLGIDVNENGIRDDVERWIYMNYKDKHPVHIDIAMQAARGYKKVLQTPEKAKEIHAEVNAPIYCEGYYSKTCASQLNKPIIITEHVWQKVSDQIFNTKERSNTYWKYDKLLSGDSYTIPWCSEVRQYCDFNTDKYEY